jgi:hypothetical protein
MAAVGHGVAGIDAQIHQQLLQVRRIRVHGADVVAQSDFEMDVRVDQGVKSFSSCCQDAMPATP